MNYFLKLLIKKLILIEIINILNTKVLLIIKSQPLGNYKTLQTGTFYLNSERPLWILQDQKNDTRSAHAQNPFKEKLKPIYYETRRQHITPSRQRDLRILKSNAQKRFSGHMNYKGLQLPRHYIPLKSNTKSNGTFSLRRYKNSKFMQNMPIFDAVPGEEAYAESRPIFIYTGNKGRMLLNTMLSDKKYPMQEPVPGQVLYPPTTVVFQPKPLVENLKQKINVTMIPFYAYEAIDPRSLITTPTAATTIANENYKLAKKYKKSKFYQAFHTPQEVYSQPVTDYAQYHNRLQYTTNSPPTLENPFNNHRFTTEPSTPTTTLSHKKFGVTYDDGSDKFQIIYEDDTPSTFLERPINLETTTTQYTTTPVPVTYESYKFDQNYYAFPLYTMSKLIETQQATEASSSTDVEISVEQQRIEKLIDTALKEENENQRKKSNEDTWFILNSRYKGPRRTNVSNLHSSKYIQQSTPNKVLNELDFNKTKLKTSNATKSTSLAANSKAVLQPKMRSLQGETINIIL